MERLTFVMFQYLQAQQLVEEQRRQMDMMDMDNTRISEQINLEIQRVKVNILSDVNIFFCNNQFVA